MKSGRPHRSNRGQDYKGRGERHGEHARSGDDARPPRYQWSSTETDDRLFIFGIHAVEAALANPRRAIRQLWLSENAERRLDVRLKERGLTAQIVSTKDLDRRLGDDTVHQGALLEAEPLPELTVFDLAAEAGDRPLVILDQVTDPHNVGAVLRSAAVFGAGGLILTRRNSPPLGGALAKAASGALEAVPVALISNLARALNELKQHGYRVIGLDGTAANSLDDEVLVGRIALVFGAEGKGLRQLTRDTCDGLARVDSDGELSSLNVSNAAAVALHFASYQRRRRSMAT